MLNNSNINNFQTSEIPQESIAPFLLKPSPAIIVVPSLIKDQDIGDLCFNDDEDCWDPAWLDNNVTMSIEHNPYTQIPADLAGYAINDN